MMKKARILTTKCRCTVYLFFKRLFDIFCSLVSIVLLCPLIIPIVLVLRFTGEGKVLYKQARIGLKNRRFGIYKFVTMLENSPNMGTRSITLPNDPRVLPIGKFLRKTKINELPQILNVLLGDMSIVGPRPLVQETFDTYSLDVQNQIYDSKPGLTGIGSIMFRDEESLFKTTKMAPAEFYAKRISPIKGSLELWYKNHRSLWVDFLIVFLTAWVILFPKSKLPRRVFRDLPEVDLHSHDFGN